MKERRFAALLGSLPDVGAGTGREGRLRGDEGGMLLVVACGELAAAAAVKDICFGGDEDVSPPMGIGEMLLAGEGALELVIGLA